MKTISHHFLLLLVSFAIMIIMGACQDDLDIDGPIDITGKNVSVSVSLDFMPLAEGTLVTHSRSDGTVAFPGDGMRNIDDLCLVIFDHEGKYYDYRKINSYQTQNTGRTDNDASNGKLAGEDSTLHVSFNCELPRGTYYLYALANMGVTSELGSTTTADFIESANLQKGVTTREEFAALRKRWYPDNYSNNSGMTGYFTQDTPASSPSTRTDDGSMPGKLITVTTSGSRLHCWLRRMASKITVTIDASHLSPDVYVYVRDIKLHSIPYDCNLFGPNVPGKNGEKPNNPGGLLSEDSNSQILMICNSEDAGKADFSDVRAHYQNWPCLTANDNSFAKLQDDFPHLEKLTHAETAPSLFFYENMQGQGESKLPDADFNGVVDSPNSNDPTDAHYRDAKPYGTYVEVTAYYVSRNTTKPGNGLIKYRFMLGKNVEHDYDAERNFHYKLTLRLLGYANEVDWHIDYNTTEEEISIPNPCYISYSYNESLTLPIIVYGELTKAEATIVRNDWEPSLPWQDIHPTEADDIYYTGALDNVYTGTDQTTGQSRKNALGFLTLIKPSYDAIGMHFSGSAAIDDDANRYLWNYWIGNGDPIAGSPLGSQNEKRNPQYKRNYIVSNGEHGSDALNQDGIYKVTHRPADPGLKYPTTLLEVPLYTRERNMVKTTAHSGANPYEGYQRRAQVKFSLDYKRDGIAHHLDTIIDVIQVRKVVNPRGVWRRWDNGRPFKVSLAPLNGAKAMVFNTLESRGSWSAEVEIGKDWILLNGNRSTVYGETGTPIEFEIKPAGILSQSSEVRCGIVKIKYHNYTCIHRIFVRQGYDPIAINEGDARWHSYNLVTASSEASSPLDEGSLFRFNNIGQPIASSNNVNDKYPWIDVQPGDFRDHTGDSLTLATGEKVLWRNITSYSAEDGQIFDESNITVSGRIMSAWDIVALRDNPQNRFAYGVCYSDGATSTEFHIDQVYGYNSIDAHNNYGMRGCFAYNAETGAQVFFPIGSSGYGTRQRDGAKVKYAGPANKLSLAGRRAALYYLYRSCGAIYWAGKSMGTTISDYTGRPEVDKTAVGLDINYTTFDFNTIGWPNFLGNSFNASIGTDACYIRMLTGDIPVRSKSPAP